MSYFIHRKEKIIYTAIDVINELGVQALSTKKIAQKESIAESTIFKHFSSKTELLSAVLDFYSQYDDDIKETIRVNSMTGLNALKFCLNSYLRYYENYPAITSITQGLDEMRYIEGLQDKVVSISQKRFDTFRMIIAKAQSEGVLPLDFSDETYADAILGAINGVIRKWRMENYSFDLFKRCMSAVSLIIKIKIDEEGGENDES